MPKKKPKGNYDVLDQEEFYKLGKSRGVIKVSEERTTKNKTVSFSREFEKDGNWIPRRGKYNFFALSFRSVGKIIDVLIRFARKFGWKVDLLNEPQTQIKQLKEQLDGILQQKASLEETNKALEHEIEQYKFKLSELRQQILKSNIEKFKKDLTEFESILTKSELEKVKEEELQTFLKDRQWIFSPEYYNIQPKKPVGSKSKFDFYLEDYKGQGTVVELELPSDSIFSSDEEYGLSTKCGQALGQLIRYTETTISVSHSSMSKIENMDEVKPLGFLVIGRTKMQNELEKLKVINSYLHSIQIMSYDMLLKRAQKMLEPWLK